MDTPAIELPQRNGERAQGCGVGKTALVVDDHPGTPALIARWLSRLGYQSLTASDGKEAQEVGLKHGVSNVSLLMTDLDMPRMHGDELAEWFLQENPLARVFVMSADLMNTKLCRGTFFLQKPFCLVALGIQLAELHPLPA